MVEGGKRALADEGDFLREELVPADGESQRLRSANFDFGETEPLGSVPTDLGLPPDLGTRVDQIEERRVGKECRL